MIIHTYTHTYIYTCMHEKMITKIILMSVKYMDFYFLPYSFFLSAFLAIETLFMQSEKRAFLFWGKINSQIWKTLQKASQFKKYMVR